MREGGEIISWVADRGFGFVKPDTCVGGDAFLHISECTGTPRRYASVMFTAEMDRKRRLVAKDAIIEE
jgi:cold shock CspA family protein